MATPAATALEYCTLLVKSKLLPALEVESLYKTWKQEKPGGDERVDSFRRFLVGQRVLTEYQAALVQRGRAEGFFLGGYKILDRIGKGHMGGVYKAVHNSGQTVALKILPASKAKNAHVLGRFQREARLLTHLDHPNVVRAFQVGESGGVHYIVMEFLEGETLNEVLERRGRLPVAEAVRLTAQALDGLQHLHDKRMVHRDVKPANLMLTPAARKDNLDTTWDATLKVLDIGLGRELFADDAPAGQVETQLTQEGSVLGTPDYLAPEQAKDARSADIRADIYSAGCVLYHCLAGRPPFPEANIMAQMLKHATEKPAPLASLADDLPPGLQDAVDRLLAKKPGDRYPTPAEASAALKPFASGGAPALASKMVPAYKDWLETESHMEMPNALQTAQSPGPPPGLVPQPAKPGTKPAPALGATVKSPPLKPGTAPAPALRKGAGVPPPTKPSSIPTPAKPSGSAPRPALAPQQPKPKPAPLQQPLRVEEVDVELVAVPPGAPLPLPIPVPQQRPLWPPDRRDWLMLAAGAAGVLGAVGLGYGMAKALRKKSEGGE